MATYTVTLTITNPSQNTGQRKSFTLTQPKAILRPPPTWDVVRDIVSPRETIAPGLVYPKRDEENLVLWLRPKRKVAYDLLKKLEYDGGRGG